MFAADCIGAVEWSPQLHPYLGASCTAAIEMLLRLLRFPSVWSDSFEWHFPFELLQLICNRLLFETQSGGVWHTLDVVHSERPFEVSPSHAELWAFDDQSALLPE